MSKDVWIERVKRLSAVRDLVRAQLDLAFARQAKYYDLHRTRTTYEVGDKVLRHTHHLSKGEKYLNAKLAEPFTGPCLIEKKNSDVVYEIFHLTDKTRHKLHVSDLKPFYEYAEKSNLVADGSTPTEQKIDRGIRKIKELQPRPKRGRPKKSPLEGPKTKKVGRPEGQKNGGKGRPKKSSQVPEIQDPPGTQPSGPDKPPLPPKEIDPPEPEVPKDFEPPKDPVTDGDVSEETSTTEKPPKRLRGRPPRSSIPVLRGRRIDDQAKPAIESKGSKGGQKITGDKLRPKLVLPPPKHIGRSDNGHSPRRQIGPVTRSRLRLGQIDKKQ